MGECLALYPPFPASLPHFGLAPTGVPPAAGKLEPAFLLELVEHGLDPVAADAGAGGLPASPVDFLAGRSIRLDVERRLDKVDTFGHADRPAMPPQK